eukprot:1159893-Pelagomonas_calceolata.AAC.2
MQAHGDLNCGKGAAQGAMLMPSRESLNPCLGVLLKSRQLCRQMCKMAPSITIHSLQDPESKACSRDVAADAASILLNQPTLPQSPGHSIPSQLTSAGMSKFPLTTARLIAIESHSQLKRQS